MNEDRHPQSPEDDESFEQQTRRIIRSLPVAATMYDGTYPGQEMFSIESLQSSASELSFSSDSPTSMSTVIYRNEYEHSSIPIVELPVTPSKGDEHPVVEFAKEVHTPSTIGEALEKSGTVLMKRSHDNRLEKQLEEIQTLMSVDDEDLVILKQPSIRAMQSQPAFSKDVMRGFLERSETMFNLMHDTTGNDAQVIVGIEEAESSDTEKPSCSRKQPNRPVDPPVVDDTQSGEFVGCFSKNENMVLYKRSLAEATAREPNRNSIDSLIVHHADCLLEAEEMTRPDIQIRQGADDNLLALLTFSDQSSALMKTSNAVAEAADSHEALKKTILTTYRELLENPDEMISMKTQATAPLQQFVPTTHSHKYRTNLCHSKETSSFGLSRGSQDGMVLQGSSKNWTKCPNTQQAIEIIYNVRLLMEDYILQNITVSMTVWRHVVRILQDVQQCCRMPVEREFQDTSLVEKIKRVLDDLLVPQDREDPLELVNQLRYTIEQIQVYQIRRKTLFSESDAWDVVLNTMERLCCVVDHEIEDPEVFLEALQYGVRNALGPRRFEDRVAKATPRAGTGPVESHPTFCSSPSVFDIGRYEPPSVGFCRPYVCFFDWILTSLWSVIVWAKIQLGIFWEFISSPPPPILAGRSVSFHQTSSDLEKLHEDRERLSDATNVIRVALENISPPAGGISTDEKSSVNVRSLEMISRMLYNAGQIELKHSVSRQNIHMQLNTTVSGELVKREADEFVTMEGTIRDRDAEVAVFFEARMVDLGSLAKVESMMECVTRIERLSDDAAVSSNLSEETIVHSAPSLDAAEVVSSLVEELISSENYEQPSEPTVTAVADQLLREIKLCMQDLLEPVASAMRNIYELFDSTVGEGDRPSVTKSDPSEDPTAIVVEKEPTGVSSPLEYVQVEQKSSQYDANARCSCSVCKPPQTVDGESTVTQKVSSESRVGESLQELLALFHDANNRLGIIDSDVTAIRNQMQQLMAEQRQSNLDGAKITQGDGHRSRRRTPGKVSQKPKKTPPIRCPVQQKQALFPQTASYCPTEIYSCHPVAPDVLVIHWKVDEDLLLCIIGYEIHIDGELRSVCFSNKRRTALIGNLDLKKHHQIALHAVPDAGCKSSVQWAPAFFLYHT